MAKKYLTDVWCAGCVIAAIGTFRGKLLVAVCGQGEACCTANRMLKRSHGQLDMWQVIGQGEVLTTTTTTTTWTGQISVPLSKFL